MRANVIALLATAAMLLGIYAGWLALCYWMWTLTA